MKNKEEILGVKLAQSYKRRREEELALARAQKLKLPYANLFRAVPDQAAARLIPRELAFAGRIFAFKKELGGLWVATDQPENIRTKKALKALTEAIELKINPVLVSTSSIEYLLSSYDLFAPRETKEDQIKIAGSLLGEEVTLVKLGEGLSGSASLSQLFERLLSGAVRLNASDIHLETEEKALRLRLRLDGLLYDVAQLPPERARAIINRLKILAELKLNITEASQDGRFSFLVDKAKYNVRVSILPSAFGESAVLRILPEEGILVSFNQLGLTDYHLQPLEEAIQKPNGLILNTGPTGSGKTTTLYAILDRIRKPEVKIITIEDPIEYRLGGITQTQVDSASSYTFANGLRAIVRQDPDVILVGEIRDQETAEIALQASLTGHLVLSTLHTNDAAGALPRLVELGINPKLFADAIELIIAQRLVRRLCPICLKEGHLEKITLDQSQRNKFELLYKALPASIRDRFKSLPNEFVRPKGCPACNGLGYRGRVGVFEVLKVNQLIAQLAASGKTAREIKAEALKRGMIPLEADGLVKILEGTTTLDEFLRVIKLE